DRLELWLVRHGETLRSVEGRIAGWTDTPLSDRGRDEARAVAPLLAGVEFDGVWSSDLVRTKETAELAWGQATASPLLREMAFGELEGRRWRHLEPEVAKALFEFRSFQAPQGESQDEVAGRLHRFIEDLPLGRHLIFAHGGVIRVLTWELGVDRFIATGSVVGVDWTSRKLLFVHERESEPDIAPASE
ncbi:MAG: histidine phosphatase family protein, partial [bacterium]|nr:histidine phosphatase family protein [bacterium]